MGKCDNCENFAELYNCKIKDNLGIRYRKLCEKCIEEMQSTSQIEILDENKDSTLSPRVLKSLEKQKAESEKSAHPIGSSSILGFIGIFWFVIALILHFVSAKKLDRASAQIFGVDSVANFQGTIYTACAFIAGVLHSIAAFIVNAINNKK